MATEVLSAPKPAAPKLSGLDAVDPSKAGNAPIAETMMSDGAAPAPSTQASTKRDGRAAPGTDYASFVGQEMCGYTIRRKLAEGGMGVVFEGEHVKIGRKGAIKVLKLEYCQSDEVVERFYQEARAVNSIRHENIVDIYDFGRDPDGRVFFVMEFLEGMSLSDRIKKGALPWAEAFPILEQTLRALKAAHDKGFVHRDLKPDNIWLQTRTAAARPSSCSTSASRSWSAPTTRRKKLTRTAQSWARRITCRPSRSTAARTSISAPTSTRWA